jgi:hypothetical protein
VNSIVRVCFSVLAKSECVCAMSRRSSPCQGSSNKRYTNGADHSEDNNGGIALVIANQAKEKRGLPNLMAILNKLILQVASKLMMKQQN